jgi:hypothetical protein
MEADEEPEWRVSAPARPRRARPAPAARVPARARACPHLARACALAHDGHPVRGAVCRARRGFTSPTSAARRDFGSSSRGRGD